MSAASAGCFLTRRAWCKDASSGGKHREGGPASAVAGRSSRRFAVPSVTALCRSDRPGLNIPVQTWPDANIPVVVSWHNAFTSALRIIRQPPRPDPLYSGIAVMKLAFLLKVIWTVRRLVIHMALDILYGLIC